MSTASMELKMTEVDRGGLCQCQGISGKWGLCFPDQSSVIVEIYNGIDPYDPVCKGWQTYRNGQLSEFLTREDVVRLCNNSVTRKRLRTLFSLEAPRW